MSFGNGGVNYASVGDFVAGLDKLVLNAAAVGGNYSLTNGTLGSGTSQMAYSTVQTSNGSLITFDNATLTTSDIIKV